MASGGLKVTGVDWAPSSTTSVMLAGHDVTIGGDVSTILHNSCGIVQERYRNIIVMITTVSRGKSIKEKIKVFLA